MNNAEIFAKNLKLLIGERSISSVAKDIGLSQQTLSRYILCQREIGIINLLRIADYFDEPLDALFNRKGY